MGLSCPGKKGEPNSQLDCWRGTAQRALEGTEATEHTALPVSPQHKSRTTPRTQINQFSSRRCPEPTKVCWRIKTPGKLRRACI